LNERIKQLRKALNFTQQEFADRIGMKRNTIASYEINRNGPSNSVISLICKAFNVNEVWLRTGEGEMFNAAPTDILDALAQEYSLDYFGRAVIERMLNLNKQQWTAVYDFALKVMDNLPKQSDTVPSTVTSDKSDAGEKLPQSNSEILTMLADLKKQNEEVLRQNEQLRAEVEILKQEDTIETFAEAILSQQSGLFSQTGKAGKSN